jgi:hypothetical protein
MVAIPNGIWRPGLDYHCPNSITFRGLYNGKYPPSPPGGGGKISADVIWGKKYEKAKRKREKM